MGRLDGKVALISGGAKASAVEASMFCREGARVVLGDVLDDEGRRVEAEIRGALRPACVKRDFRWPTVILKATR